jgi:hypothetical protein
MRGNGRQLRPRRWLERAKNVGDVCAQTIEKGQDWSKFSDLYLSGKAGIEFNVRMWPGWMDEAPHDYVVLAHTAVGSIVCPMTGRLPGEDYSRVGIAVPVGIDAVCEGTARSAYDDQVKSPVLIYVRQSGQGGQGMEMTLGETLVRLESLQDQNVAWIHIFEIPPSDKQVLLATDKRELDTNGFLVRGHSSEGSPAHLPHEMIQGGSHVLDGVTDHQSPPGVKVGDLLDVVDDLPGVVVVLSPQSDEVHISGKLCAQDADVSFRPVQLRPGTVEVKATHERGSTVMPHRQPSRPNESMVAAEAGNGAIGPAQTLDELEATPGVSEVTDSLNEGIWQVWRVVLHALIIPGG